MSIASGQGGSLVECDLGGQILARFWSHLLERIGTCAAARSRATSGSRGRDQASDQRYGQRLPAGAGGHLHRGRWRRDGRRRPRSGPLGYLLHGGRIIDPNLVTVMTESPPSGDAYYTFGTSVKGGSVVGGL